MSRIDAAWARAWFSYAALRLGTAGIAGVVLLTGCAMAMAWLRWQERDDSTAQRIVQLRAGLQQAASPPRPAATAQSFVAELPALDQVPHFIETLHHQATRSGLQIERAEYRSPTLAAGLVMRSQLVLPLTGRYPDIARWLGQVLQQNPSAAIDELSLQRESADSDQVRARIVISHYSRVAP